MNAEPLADRSRSQRLYSSIQMSFTRERVSSERRRFLVNVRDSGALAKPVVALGKYTTASWETRLRDVLDANRFKLA